MQRQSLRELPANKTPKGTRCIQIDIPDDDEWEQQAYSEFYRLALWMLWYRDEGKNGAKVAKLWRKALETWRHCDGTETKVYEEIDEMPAFRVDCDCNVFVQCCDGTEVQLAKLSDVPKSSSPSDSNTQPTPGGGTAQYCQTMSAQGKLLLPTTVNTGDIITLESATGAGNDGVEAAWRCVDGSQFFAGACVGFPHTDGADPVPTANHMALIVVVGGTPHAFASGSFTVPGGITDAEAYIQVNDSTLLGNFGSYQICVQVQNNQLSTWSRTFNFNVANSSWMPHNGIETSQTTDYVPGLGWQGPLYSPSSGNNATLAAIISPTFASTTITSVRVIGTDATDSEAGAHAPRILNQAGEIANQPAGSPVDYTWFGSAASTHIEVWISAYRSSGATPNALAVIRSVTITGTGSDPF